MPQNDLVTAARLADYRLHNHSNEELGYVVDVVIEVAAARVTHLVVRSSRGLLQKDVTVLVPIAAVFALLFVLFQRPALRLAGLLARRALPDLGAQADAVAGELAAVYAQPLRIGLSFLLNLLAWGATALWSWAALRLMGEGASLWHAAALESAIFALRSAAFLIPGALGVQEAGYALLAPVVGIDPRAALALSLVKRARDLAIGVPTLLAWQAGEVRRGAGAGSAPSIT